MNSDGESLRGENDAVTAFNDLSGVFQKSISVDDDDNGDNDGDGDDDDATPIHS